MDRVDPDLSPEEQSYVRHYLGYADALIRSAEENALPESSETDWRKAPCRLDEPPKMQTAGTRRAAILTDESSPDKNKTSDTKPPEVFLFCFYLITPRSEPSINRSSMSTSSPRSFSDFNFSSACVVFSLEFSNTRKAWWILRMRSSLKPAALQSH